MVLINSENNTSNNDNNNCITTIPTTKVSNSKSCSTGVPMQADAQARKRGRMAVVEDPERSPKVTLKRALTVRRSSPESPIHLP